MIAFHINIRYYYLCVLKVFLSKPISLKNNKDDQIYSPVKK